MSFLKREQKRLLEINRAEALWRCLGCVSRMAWRCFVYCVRVLQVAVLPQEVAERHQAATAPNAQLLSAAELQEDREVIGYDVARVAHADDGRHQTSVLPRLMDELQKRMVHISQLHGTMLLHRLPSFEDF